ncbi:hypothetical protein LB941_07750 [Ligilactobacillus sp. WILCCON 0076]|uniref:DUF2187 domain-containing protein n=1 Tax=Ligilactobacillus ubinensis TaxID=2876789 RepID=A0A9X2FK94_9LACO|nr:hypothetical protein [Ligilactobacillus ubinensis]MCP0887227.1 hypothetical protein [Ligilactobacillus ubinensis]
MSEKSRTNVKEIEVSELGKPFVKGSHVAFTFHRHHFVGTVEKQLKNSAILVFDKEFAKTMTAMDMKQKIVISYSKIQFLEEK